MKNVSKISIYSALIATLVIFFPAVTLGHFESDSTREESPYAHALIVEPDLFAVQSKVPIFIEIKDKSTQTHIKDLSVKVVVNDANSKTVFEGKVEEKGENYVFEYTFDRSGDYTIHVNFNYGPQGRNSEHNFYFPIFVSEAISTQTNSFFIFAIIAGVLSLCVIYFLGFRKKNLKAAAIWVIIIIALAALAYSLSETLKQDQGLGIVTCVNSTTCYWTAHIHAYLPISICGNDFRLPIEVGALNGPHTHEEKNIAHWHDRLPYDQKTSSITNTEPLTLGAFSEAVKINLDNDRINDKKNGDLCPDGTTGTLKIFVNGKYYSDNIKDYIWRNRDVISIFFSSQTKEALEAELLKNPITFPALGRG